ncbi:MAG: hypothetical protein ETSY1_00160 [Candidatus Entotheonella factor]|uniref:P-type Zn(2+) transporter n=1 Tax=Entotheonella factor TaxID=1429438 RepID=W4LZT3_ENTF1|nr:MAG: hypothetical protein ETSY1_00160 [Candidatus Entotheonella factor]
MLIGLIALFAGSYLVKKSHEQNRISTPNSQTAATLSASVMFDKSRKLIHNVFSSLSSEDRERQQRLLNQDNQVEIEVVERRINRDLILSAGAMGLALLSSFFPALVLVSGLAVLYLLFPIFQLMWNDLRVRRITIIFTDVIVVLVLLASGRHVIAALIAFLSKFSLKMFRRVEAHSQQQLIDVFDTHARKVWVEQDGVEMEVDYEQVRVGDLVTVNPGEVIPIDGRIQDGFALVDQQVLTGEAQPMEKAPGDPVFAATTLLSGRIKILVETAGEDSVAAQIGQILNQTQSYKDTLISRGKKTADDLTLPALLLSGGAWALLGSTQAVAVLYSPLGRDMALWGILSVLNYLQILSRRGILVKDGRVLESIQQIDTVIFDKTGTLTLEQPIVGRIDALNGFNETSILRYAAAAEYRQSHPIAKALIARAEAEGLDLPELDEARYEVGYGIKVSLDHTLIRVGSLRFIEREGIALPEAVQGIRSEADEQGFSLVAVAVDDRLGGLIELQPSIRPEAAEIIRGLKARRKRIYMISGDREHPTRRLAEALGIDRYFAETLPENKANLVQRFRQAGQCVCFVGDGINDAIALQAAHVSVSLRGASSAATDTAQIILMDGSLNHLETLFAIADDFEANMETNRAITIAPGAINIAGIFLFNTGLPLAMVVRYTTLLAGLGNTLQPLIYYQDLEDRERAERETKRLERKLS